METYGLCASHTLYIGTYACIYVTSLGQALCNSCDRKLHFCRDTAGTIYQHDIPPSPHTHPAITACPSVEDGLLILNTTEHSVGTVVNVSCPLGYTLRGASIITCYIDGRWSYSPVYCRNSALTLFITHTHMLNNYYVCIHVHNIMYALCMYTYIHTHAHLYMQTHLYVCMHVYYACTYTYSHTCNYKKLGLICL